SLADAGALPLHREPTDPDVLLGETVATFGAEAARAGVSIIVDVPSDLPLIEVDPVRIREVLSNLLGNALRHTPVGATITASGRVAADGATVTFAVADTGIGIDPDLLPHVFDRFARGPGSRGSGLGLAIARDLVVGGQHPHRGRRRDRGLTPPASTGRRRYPRVVRPIPAPFDRLTLGLSAEIDVSGSELLNRRLLTKDLAFPLDERTAFGLHGLLPDRVLSIEEQLELEHEHLGRKSDDLERYIGMAALQDRNATLFYRLLAERMEEYLPVVYTPTVGRACQEFSHIVRRTRGIWLTPADRHRIPEVLRAAPFEDVRLIVVTDNERILGLGDQGAGGMAIPIGKLALYTAACGIHPALTLPVSLDVGTDNQALLDDPLYLGFRAPRLRGAAYDAFVEAFVQGVHVAWPGCLIQFEDFKQHNALRLLDRYRSRVPCFNDDIQGTAAVVVAGIAAGIRHLGTSWADQRVVLAGAGAAGIGIARLLRLAMLQSGMSESEARRALVLVDSQGLVHSGRDRLDADKVDLAYPSALAVNAGLVLDRRGRENVPSLLEVVAAIAPTVLIGTTGHAGSFSEAVIRAMAVGTARPIVLPLSNPTANTEAVPADVLAWTDGRALIATGSPFAPVETTAGRRQIGQANNVFIFPGVGLGAIAAESREVTDEMFLAAAQALAEHVLPERLESGALYPSVTTLRTVSREIAILVAGEAIRAGLSPLPADTDVAALIDDAMWWPAYAPYRRASGHATPHGITDVD
ncbi:MAG: maeA 2, partial [Chloroflexi bacterium]|nr:maeA 2 [Chloroflexota bacterium]